MAACQQLCADLDTDAAELGKRCKFWSYYNWGSCYLHNSDSTIVADRNSITGHSQCDEQQSWDPQAAIDDDANTCFHIPAGERTRYLLVDLGREVELDDIYIETGRVDSLSFEIRAGVGLDNVIAQRGQGAHRSEQLSFAPFVNSSCNGGEEISMRYGQHGESYATTTWTPEMDKIKVPCTNRARYITIRPRDWDKNFTVCSLEIMVDEGAVWDEVDRLTLMPNAKYRFDKDSTTHDRENGLGPWVVHKLKAPVVTRYLRIAVESIWKMGGGLARVEVWSDKHVPRYQVKNNVGADSNLTLPGLLMELYDREAAVDTSSATHWASKLHSFFEAKPPGARAVIAQVDIHTTYGHRAELTDKGSVLVGGSNNALSKTFAVKFQVPFPAWDEAQQGWGQQQKPKVTFNIHKKHFDSEALKKSVLSEEELDAYTQGFTFTATNITREGFAVTVERPAACVGRPESVACTEAIAPYCTSNGGGGGTANPKMVEAIDKLCPLLCSTCDPVNMTVAEPWDLVADKYGTHLSVEFVASTALPSFIDENLNKDAGRTYSWAQDYVARITGELVPWQTGWHTLHLDGAPMARLLIDGVEAINVQANSMIEYDRVWNDALKKNEYFATGKLKIPVGSKRIFLTKGRPVHIEIQSVRRKTYGNGGLPSTHVVELHWEGEGISKSLVPLSALQHRARDMCLTYLNRGERVYTMECSTPPTPDQLWRFDGGYIRPAGNAYTSAEGGQSTRCLTVHGTAKATGWAKDFGKSGTKEVRDCSYGGTYPIYLDEGRKCREVSWRPWQLWTFDAQTGTIASRMGRAEEPVDTPVFGRTSSSTCHDLYSPIDGDCSAMDYIEKQAAGQCEADSQAEQVFCLSGIPAGAAIAGVDQNSPQLLKCEKKTETPSLMWELIVADPTAVDWRTKPVYGGMYTQKKQTYLHASDTKLRFNWGQRIYCDATHGCDSCKIGSENNTCEYACDGRCDESKRLYGEHNAAGCDDNTDQYDCGGRDFGNGGVEECARQCANNDACTAFVTLEWELYAHSQWCGYYTQPYDDMDRRQGFDEDATLYIKNPGVPAPAAHTNNVDCSAFGDGTSCPRTTCKFVPVGAVNTSLGRTEDPTCVDKNGDTSGVYNLASTAVGDTGGGDEDPAANQQFFTCEQYIKISEQEMAHYSFIKTTLCDTEFVASSCALTCNKTEYCAASPSVCVALDQDDAVPEPAAKDLECGGDNVKLLNGRCRCLGATACTTGADAGESGCHSSSAAGGKRVAEWFDPECTNCKCALKNGETTPQPRVHPKRKWATQRWSSTTTTTMMTTPTAATVAAVPMETPSAGAPGDATAKGGGGTDDAAGCTGEGCVSNDCRGARCSDGAGGDAAEDVGIGASNGATQLDGSLSEAHGKGGRVAGGIVAGFGILLILVVLGFAYYKHSQNSTELPQSPKAGSYENPMYNTGVTAFPEWDRRGTKGSRQSVPQIPSVDVLTRTASVHRQSGMLQRRGSAHAILESPPLSPRSLLAAGNAQFAQAAETSTFRDLAVGLGLGGADSAYMDVTADTERETNLQRRLSRRRSSLGAGDTFSTSTAQRGSQESVQFQISAQGHLRVASTRKVNPLANRSHSDFTGLVGTLGLDM